jgi:hypothetical protein
LVPDARVTLLGLLGIQLLHLGYIEQAREHLQQAYVLARERGQSMDRTVAIWLNALFEVRLAEAKRVAALADEMQTLVDGFSLAHTRATCRWFRAWADARTGQPLDGYRRIREAYEQNRQLGMVTGGGETLGYASEALLLADDCDAAEREPNEALEIVKVHGERVYFPQLFLIQAAIARARGHSAAAEVSARQVIAEARAQGAPWLELVALLYLCERDACRPKTGIRLPHSSTSFGKRAILPFSQERSRCSNAVRAAQTCPNRYREVGHGPVRAATPQRRVSCLTNILINSGARILSSSVDAAFEQQHRWKGRRKPS